jgi:hypothetical protein
MQRRNLLGYVGIALGALALVVALVGQFDGFQLGLGRQGRNDQQRGYVVQAAQPAQAGPQQNVQPDAAMGRPDARDQQAQAGQRSQAGRNARTDGPGFGREHGSFFSPLAWIGALAQGVVAVLAILVGLMLLRRPGGGGPGSWPHGDVTPPEDEPRQVSNPPEPDRTVYM